MPGGYEFRSTTHTTASRYNNKGRRTCSSFAYKILRYAALQRPVNPRTARFLVAIQGREKSRNLGS